MVAADSPLFTAFNGRWCGRVGLITVGMAGRAFVTTFFTPYCSGWSVRVDWGEGAGGAKSPLFVAYGGNPGGSVKLGIVGNGILSGGVVDLLSFVV